MALYRTVSLQFWTDPKVDDEFSPEDKYFYLYLLTNPHTALCGCYEISMKQMCRETGYNEDTVHRLLERLEKQHDVIRYSKQTKEVLILNWHKYNWSKSEKIIAGVLDNALHIKDHNFRAYLADLIRSYGGDADTLSIGYQYPMDTSVSVTVTDTNTVTDKNTVIEDHSNTIQNVSVHASEGAKSQPEQKKSNAKKTVARHKHGEFGWVLLSDAEYKRLLEKMGDEELSRCIKYVDESAQKTKNKNGWVDWNLVIRNCHENGWANKKTQPFPRPNRTIPTTYNIDPNDQEAWND